MKEDGYFFGFDQLIELFLHGHVYRGFCIIQSMYYPIGSGILILPCAIVCFALDAFVVCYSGFRCTSEGLLSSLEQSLQCFLGLDRIILFIAILIDFFNVKWKSRYLTDVIYCMHGH